MTTASSAPAPKPARTAKALADPVAALAGKVERQRQRLGVLEGQSATAGELLNMTTATVAAIEKRLDAAQAREQKQTTAHAQLARELAALRSATESQLAIVRRNVAALGACS
jgi:hypothetical protein